MVYNTNEKRVIKMKFLAKIGTYKPCGIYTLGHYILLFTTIILIIMALFYTLKRNVDVAKIIKRLTIVIVILEIIMISFKVYHNGWENINSYVPLYYCSLFIYAGLLSSFGKGVLKRMGDVFLATGGIIGGLVFIFYPSTSLPDYPAWHLVSIHSFFFHGSMIFIGLLINFKNYVELKKEDIKYYAPLVGVICLLAYIINLIFHSNLMFISDRFDIFILRELYDWTQMFYPLVVSLIQMFLPFYVVYLIRSLLKKRIVKQAKIKI